MSNRTIKNLKFEILAPLTLLINSSINEGIFPGIWKLGRVCPIHKRGAKTDASNYRPIAITSNVGKLAESVIRLQLSEALEKVLPDNMHGFRPHRSTETALVQLMEKVKLYKSQGMKVALLALDASAAFDLLDHNLIIRSLEAIGAGPVMIRWISHYLSSCEQYVDVAGTFSETWSSDVGVGQGKRLSSDLFNLGTLSYAIWSTILENTIFADDGSDIVFASTDAELNTKLRSTADARISWFNLAGLTLNASKSELLGFGTQPDPLLIDGTLIKPTNSIKFLGLTIQSDMKFTKHTEETANKLRSAAGRIRSEGRNVTVADRRVLFNGWIRSLVNFNGLAYLPHLCENQLQQLTSAYNSGIRAIFGLPKSGYAPIDDLRCRLKLPSIDQLKEHLLFKEAWIRRNDFVRHTEGPITRGRANLKVPLADQRGFAGKRLASILPKYWNELPLDIKNLSNEKSAKLAIRKWVFNPN